MKMHDSEGNVIGFTGGQCCRIKDIPEDVLQESTREHLIRIMEDIIGNMKSDPPGQVKMAVFVNEPNPECPDRRTIKLDLEIDITADHFKNLKGVVIDFDAFRTSFGGSDT